MGADHLAARTVLWAAGVQASPLARTLGAPLDRAGRVKVEPDLTVPGRPEIFVIGDLAAIEHDGRPVPGVAPAAMQMGRHAARERRSAPCAGEPRQPFRYRDKGSLATIGRSRAVAMFGAFKLTGFLAWVAWLGDPHLLPDRLPQPLRGDVHLGVGLPDLRAQRPPHPRAVGHFLLR